MNKNKGILVKNLNKTHENKWVALSADRKKMIASSVDLISLRKKVGNMKVVFTRIPVAGTIFAF
ncbi:MAG: hypothetical protein Q8P17_05420 [bacterium]|nr:hypothetical protein [bacterium]